MKAIVWTRYGTPDVLKAGDVATPTPGENEVRVKIHAATVTTGDCELRALNLQPYFALPLRLLFGVFKPSRIKILGQEFAGAVDAVGSGVTRFKVGDRVFGTTGLSFAAYAEYKCVPADAQDTALSIIPDGFSYDEAATIPTGGLEALHFIHKTGVREGERVLINGAGGSIGVLAIQLAKNLGAHVTAVDRAEKSEMMRAVGADEMLDYRREDFTTRGQQYDVIFDVVGKTPFARAVRALAPHGRYLIGNPRIRYLFQRMRMGKADGKQVFIGAANQTPEGLSFLSGLMADRRLKAIIDRRYPLAETAEAHRYVESGQKKGNVVITVA